MRIDVGELCRDDDELVFDESIVSPAETLVGGSLGQLDEGTAASAAHLGAAGAASEERELIGWIPVLRKAEHLESPADDAVEVDIGVRERVPTRDDHLGAMCIEPDDQGYERLSEPPLAVVPTRRRPTQL